MTARGCSALAIGKRIPVRGPGVSTRAQLLGQRAVLGGDSVPQTVLATTWATCRLEIVQAMASGQALGDVYARKLAARVAIETSLAVGAVVCITCATIPVGNRSSSGAYELNCPDCNHTPGRAYRVASGANQALAVSAWNTVHEE
jgi:hypothetical protein